MFQRFRKPFRGFKKMAFSQGLFTLKNLRSPWVVSLLLGWGFFSLPLFGLPQEDLGFYREKVALLSSDDMEGRGPGTQGLIKARDNIANHFQSLKLKPAFKGSYFQNFPLNLGGLIKTQALSLNGQSIDASNYSAMGLSSKGVFEGEALFLGYGIRSEKHRYDSYANLEPGGLKGKIAVVFRYEPVDQNGRSLFAGAGSRGNWSSAAWFMSKARLAAENGASALIIVNPPSHDTDPIQSTLRSSPRQGAEIPVLRITSQYFQELLATSEISLTLSQLQEKYNQKAAEAIPLKGKISGHVEKEERSFQVHNVAAILPGSGKLKNQVLVVGGHYDHLGNGEFGSRGRDRSIHNGADDNASGTAGVLLLAKRFAEKVENLARDRRTLVFVGFAAEELGLLGSAHFVENLTDLGMEPGQLTAMFNFDMIGRSNDNGLKIMGVGSSDRWPQLVEKAVSETGLHANLESRRGSGSDHVNFHRIGVPVLFFFTGLHSDYHRPSDTADKIDVAGAVHIIDTAELILQQLWTDPKRLEFKP